MYEINLRNWRDDRREKKTKSFIELNVYISSLVLIVLVLLHLILGTLLNNQTKVNNYLKNEEAILDQKLAQITEYENEIKSITERMKIINKLQGERTDLVYVFDEIARITPKEIRLTGLKKESGFVDIEGVSVSQLTISRYLKDLKESNKLLNPKLDQVLADEKENGFERSRFYIKAQTPSNVEETKGVTK